MKKNIIRGVIEKNIYSPTFMVSSSDASNSVF